MPELASQQIAIIGGGCSGALTALHLSRDPSCFVTLYDREGDFGRGVAYGSRREDWLLNVPASGMGAYADDVPGFLKWLEAHGRASDPYAFVPRAWFGEYLQYLLDQVPASRFKRVVAEVTDLIPLNGRYAIESTSGRDEADGVVLALGNQPPSIPPGFPSSGEGVVINPWNAEALESIAHRSPILVVGTGLTAVDVLLRLEKLNPTARFVALSRRGLLPLGHAPTPIVPRPFKLSSPTSLRRLFRESSETVAAELDGDWRPYIDGIRPYTAELWNSLPLSSQRRFLRHLRPYWEAGRHRLAPELTARVDALRRAGRLELLRGRLIQSLQHGSEWEVTFGRGGESQSARFGAIVNCTGFGSWASAPSPLLGGLLGRKILSLDALKLGVRVGTSLRAITADGRELSSLRVMGALCRGTLWESNAVRELRQQAAVIASDLPAALNLSE